MRQLPSDSTVFGRAWIICVIDALFVMLLCLFIAALWSPAWKGLTSWLSFVMCYCIFVTYPCGILGKVWYLIVSISDLCCLSYLELCLLGNCAYILSSGDFFKINFFEKENFLEYHKSANHFGSKVDHQDVSKFLLHG